MRSLKDSVYGVVDLSVVLMIGIAFAAMMVIGFIMYTLRDQLLGTGAIPAGAEGAKWNTTNNITSGFDDAIGLILVAITVFILALAISALLLLRGR